PTMVGSGTKGMERSILIDRSARCNTQHRCQQLRLGLPLDISPIRGPLDQGRGLSIDQLPRTEGSIICDPDKCPTMDRQNDSGTDGQHNNEGIHKQTGRISTPPPSSLEQDTQSMFEIQDQVICRIPSREKQYRGGSPQSSTSTTRMEVAASSLPKNQQP